MGALLVCSSVRLCCTDLCVCVCVRVCMCVCRYFFPPVLPSFNFCGQTLIPDSPHPQSIHEPCQTGRENVHPFSDWSQPDCCVCMRVLLVCACVVTNAQDNARLWLVLGGFFLPCANFNHYCVCEWTITEWLYVVKGIFPISCQ